MLHTICIRIRSSSVDQTLRNLWNCDDEPSAILSRVLNQDTSESAIWWDSSRSRVIVSSPRVYVVLVRETGMDAALTVISVQAADPAKRKRQARKRSDFEVRWTQFPTLETLELTTFLNALQGTADKSCDNADDFWGYWEEYVKAEHARLDELRSHPGWTYTERSNGARGSIELRVSQPVDQIAADSRGRLRFPAGREARSTIFISRGAA